VAALYKARTVIDRSKPGVAVSNPSRGMGVCQRFSMLCYPVWVEVLRRAGSAVQGVLPNVHIDSLVQKRKF
jgi:hypothetical protein